MFLLHHHLNFYNLLLSLEVGEDELPEQLYTDMESTVKVYTEENFKNSVISVFGAINERKIREVRMNLEKLTPVGPEDKTLEGSVNELWWFYW